MEPLSKTKKKKEALSLQDLGVRLIKLSAEQLKSIDLPENVLTAVTLAKTIKKHGALDRQMQYIGSLMRKCDPTPVQEALLRIEQGKPVRAPKKEKSEKASV